MDFKEKLTNLQAELKAPKNMRNTFGNYNYRNAESVLEAVKPLLIKHRLTLNITDDVDMIGDRFYVIAVARIVDMDSELSVESRGFAREGDTKKGMDESQITGAASSYARKYALNGLLLLDDTKDADSNEYQAQTQNKGNTVPKKTVAKATQPIKIVCADCGGQITDYQGTAAAKIAQATAKKYGKPICMNCSAKRRAEAKAQEEAAELPVEIPNDEGNLPFDLQ